MSTRYDFSEHTHDQPTCAECDKVSEQRKRDFEEAEQLVDELMVQWDKAVGTMGQRLTQALQHKSREVFEGVKRRLR